MILDIGIVLFNHGILSHGMLNGEMIEGDSYAIGDIIPVLYNIVNGEHQVMWLENTIKGLKVGDVILFNIHFEIIKKIEVNEYGMVFY